MTQERQESYFRRAILGPIGIPIAVLIGVAFMIVNLSRVLLAVNKNASVVVAVGVAIVIMAGCTLAASRRRIRNKSLIALLVLFAVAIGSAGAVAAKHGERKAEKVESKVAEPAKPEPAVSVVASPSSNPVASGPALDLTAKSFAFTPTALQAKGGGTITVSVANNDAVQHNWSLYEDSARTKAIYTGDAFGGPGTTHDYTFPAPPPGAYYFRCDIHPAMTGTLTIS